MRWGGAFGAATLLVGWLWFLPVQSALSAGCVNGVYRAGCAGPNGAVGVRKAPVYRSPYYRHPAAVAPYRPPVVVAPRPITPAPVVVVPRRPLVVVPVN